MFIRILISLLCVFVTDYLTLYPYAIYLTVIIPMTTRFSDFSFVPKLSFTVQLGSLAYLSHPTNACYGRQQSAINLTLVMSLWLSWSVTD
jgi:hypothetical protein